MTMMMSEQTVSNQSHYTDWAFQPIEEYVMEFNHDEFVGFLKGNVRKYTKRYAKKNGVEDLKKAQVYLNWWVEYEETNGITIQNADGTSKKVYRLGYGPKPTEGAMT